jgi:hypothetical protein
MNIDGKPQPMSRNGPEPTKEFLMVTGHRFSLTNGQDAYSVYAVKPLNDKAFNLSWSQGTFCYTWHTLRPGGGQIREERGPR